TPIAAILLAVELLLFEWSPRSFIPVAAAAIIADVERTAAGLPSPLFPVHGEVAISLGGLLCWLVVGLLSGLLSGVLTRLVYACEDLFLKLPVHWMWWPALGGVVVGIGGWLEPQALGVGYSNIASMLQGNVLPPAALALLAVKAIIWAVALGSGTSGGVLAPLLIMGGGLGVGLAAILPAASPGMWALMAMCATMGGTMRAPLTATFFAVELTGNTHMLLPLIAACVTAHAVTVLLMRRSSLTLHQTAAFLTSPDTKHPSFPVVDSEGRVLGIVDPPAVLAWRRAGKPRQTPLGDLLVGSRHPVAYPDEYLEGLIDRMMQANVAHLPVIDPANGRLVGYVSWKDLMRARGRMREEETQRVVFYRVR